MGTSLLMKYVEIIITVAMFLHFVEICSFMVFISTTYVTWGVKGPLNWKTWFKVVGSIFIHFFCGFIWTYSLFMHRILIRYWFLSKFLWKLIDKKTVFHLRFIEVFQSYVKICKNNILKLIWYWNICVNKMFVVQES